MFKKLLMIAGISFILANATAQAQEITRSYDEFDEKTTWTIEFYIDETNSKFTAFRMSKEKYLRSKASFIIYVMIVRESVPMLIKSYNRLLFLIDQKRYDLTCANDNPNIVGAYPITPKILKALAYGKVIKVRVYGIDSTATFEIPRSKQAIFRKFYNDCVTKEE